jgi:glutamate-5-semialdehyde dehydrogenase
MAVVTASVTEICAGAKRASRQLGMLGSGVKDAALHGIADALVERTAEILDANQGDLVAGREAGLSGALVDRLTLDQGRIEARPMACGGSRHYPTRSAR